MQLAYLAIEDLVEVFGWLVCACALAGFFGSMAFRMLEEIGRGLASMVRETVWFNRHRAALYLRLSQDERVHARMDPVRRHRFIKRCVERCAFHANKAERLEGARNYRKLSSS